MPVDGPLPPQSCICVGVGTICIRENANQPQLLACWLPNCLSKIDELLLLLLPRGVEAALYCCTTIISCDRFPRNSQQSTPTVVLYHRHHYHPHHVVFNPIFLRWLQYEHLAATTNEQLKLICIPLCGVETILCG